MNCAPKITCDPNDVYRKINGSCNNLCNPLWGSSRTPYLRLADAVYSDGESESCKIMIVTNILYVILFVKLITLIWKTFMFLKISSYLKLIKNFLNPIKRNIFTYLCVCLKNLQTINKSMF